MIQFRVCSGLGPCRIRSPSAMSITGFGGMTPDILLVYEGASALNPHCGRRRALNETRRQRWAGRTATGLELRVRHIRLLSLLHDCGTGRIEPQSPGARARDCLMIRLDSQCYVEIHREDWIRCIRGGEYRFENQHLFTAHTRSDPNAHADSSLCTWARGERTFQPTAHPE